MNHEHLPGMTQAEIDAAVRAARSERYIISADSADDAPAPFGRWIATALLVAAVLLGALLFSGCAAPGRGGVEPEIAGEAINWHASGACLNCAPLFEEQAEAEEGAEDAE